MKMPPTNETKKPFSRLPTNVTPKEYNIHLAPDLKNLTFSGLVNIDVTVNQSAETIVLNALDLSFVSAAFTIKKTGQVVTASGLGLSNDDEIVNISFGEMLPAGEGTLNIIYSGCLNDKLKGFYRCKYPGVDGAEDRYTAVTHFEPTNARMCFPCWDEPAHKALFRIKITAPKDLVALSNMPEVSSLERGDLKEVSFDVTPLMSTYLIAIIVGHYDHVEDVTRDGVKVRIFTPPGKKEQGSFALEIATKSLPFYADYFKIKDGMPKMDLIALSDFAIGAMENWGLVTFRETCLLVDPNNTSAVRKQSVALVIAHELAHMWFGNLVTMEWWTDLWLKEGFANFIEYLCVDHLCPHYKIWDQFITQTFTSAMHLDGLHSSHPIEVPVGHPSEIDEIFDRISYDKGASIIRMLHVFLGNDHFREGLVIYLKRHQFSNTNTEDLWKALEEASSKPVGNVMTTWTKQKGFPCITLTDSQLGKDRVLNLSQEKFCSNGILPDSEKETMWMVPITFIASGQEKNVAHDFVLREKTSELVVPDLGPNDWIKVNRGSVGTYRVSYSSSMLEKLLPAVESKVLPAMDRLNLHDDLFALVKAGKRNTSEILKLMSSFKNEDDYVVWTSLSGCLSRLNQLLSNTDIQDGYQVWGRTLVQKQFAELGWEPKADEGYTVNLLRTLIISQLSSFKDPSVLEKSKTMFENHLAGSFVIPADIRSTVYRTVARDCDEKTYQSFLQLYDDSELHEEKNRILGALGSVTDASLIQRTLEFSISDKVRSQDTIMVLAFMSSSRLGREMTWKFFKEHANMFLSRYEGGVLVSRLVSYVTSEFATEEMAREIEEFFEKTHFPGAERTIQQSLENIRLTSQWLDRDLGDIKAFIQKVSQ